MDIDYNTSDGSATGGAGTDDYNEIASSTLTIPSGFLSGTIGVTINDDTVTEFSEEFYVILKDPGIPNVSISKSTGTCTIIDDDQININIDDVTVNEGAVTAQFAVTLNQPAPVAGVTVDYSTADNTAIAIDLVLGDGDYDSVSGTLNFASGETEKTITVPINNDLDIETDETFYMDLLNESLNAVIEDFFGECTIIDNDNNAPVANDDSYSVNEDNTLTIDVASGVLGNDTDAEGNPLTAILVSYVSNGALTLNADGSFIYTPNTDFNGADSFTYNANDGN